MTLNVDTWVTISEANSYLNTKWGAQSWASLSQSDKEKLLISAFRWINSLSDYSIAATCTEAKVKYAQIECAWIIYTAWDDYQKRQDLYQSGVRSFNFDGWQESLVKPDLPFLVKELLSGFVTGSGGRIIEMKRDYI